MHRYAATLCSNGLVQVHEVDSTKMVISGLPTPESVPAWVQAWVTAGVAEWVPPQVLLAQQAVGNGGASAAVVWLYQAPWAHTGPGALRLNSWISLQRQALRHRARQPVPWMLVNIEAVNPDQLAEELGIWVADADDADVASDTSAGSEQTSSGLAALWAKLFEWSAPQAWDVYEALEAAAWAAPGLPQPWVREQLPTPELRSLEALQKQMTDAAAVQSRVAELERGLLETQAEASRQLEEALKAQEHAQRQAQARERDAAEAKAQAELQAAVEQARAEGRAAAEQAQQAAQQAQTLADEKAAALAEAQQEGELLLLQLHQVQEELEQLFLQGKERDAADAKARAELQAAVDQAKAEGYAAAEQARAEGRAAVEEAKAEGHAAAERAKAEGRAALESAQSEARAAAERAQAELTQRTRERDEARQATEAAKVQAQAAEAKARSELQAAVEQARAEGRASHEQARAEGRAAAERAQQAAQQAQALADQRAAALTESQQEGELLLLQLHQVQEELETHFLRGKDLEQQLQGVRARYQRLQKRFPQAVDVDYVAVAAVDASADVPFVTWRMTGLAVAGKVWPEVTLRTTLQAEGTGLLLDAPAGSPLADCMSGPLVLKALTARDAGQLEIFRTIGSQAWQALIAAAAAVDEALSSIGAPIGAPADFDATFWRQALGAPTAPALRALPPVFRHDGVRLKREKVNPDYEHLWLAFEGATFGPQDMTGFEMRLGAAQVRPGGFSQLPKLEFPLKADGKPPFEGWFEESHDDFGPKYELRADLNRQAFDLAVWSRMPKVTQSLLLSVIVLIPFYLDDLAREGREITRPWSTWKQLYVNMADVMRGTLSPSRMNKSINRDEIAIQGPKSLEKIGETITKTESFISTSKPIPQSGIEKLNPSKESKTRPKRTMIPRKIGK